MELEYTSDLSSAAERIEGSNPSTLTNGSADSLSEISLIAVGDGKGKRL